MDTKIAFVSGSTSGIGKAIAAQLLAKGHTVIVSSHEQLTDSEVQAMFEGNPNVTFVKCDISNHDQVEATANEVRQKFGRLDYLVANAGVMPKPGSIDNITMENLNRIIDINLKGTFWTLQILGKLVQTTSTEGAIVTMTSVDGIIGEPYGVIYSATKAGIISLTKSFARYFKQPLVRVNAVAPGLIDTPLTASSGENPADTTDLSVIERMGTSEEIAQVVNFLLSPEASFITGQILAVDGGFTLK